MLGGYHRPFTITQTARAWSGNVTVIRAVGYPQWCRERYTYQYLQMSVACVKTTIQADGDLTISQ